MRALLVIVSLLAVTPVAAQVQYRATDTPQIDASGEAWFQLREPIRYADDLYYPVGSAVFFNGDTMARTGHYNGVPLYADTTLEPFSIVLVPKGRGLLQPYERMRRGDLAGTVGSRAPNVIVARPPTVTPLSAAAAAPTAPPAALGAISVYSPDPATAAPAGALVQAVSAVSAVPATTASHAIATVLRPQTNDGLWIRYSGATWVSAGPGVTATAAFERVGEHLGFPVFRREPVDDVVYLPTRAGVVAPYRRKAP